MSRVSESELQMMQVFCTAVTGFSWVAEQEVLRKIECVENCKSGRGNVRFSVPITQIGHILQLRSVDNVFVVIFEKCLDGLQKMGKEEAMKLIQDQIPSMNWKVGIEAWESAAKILKSKIERDFDEIQDAVEKSLQSFIENGSFAPMKDDESLPKFRVTCKRAGNQDSHQFSSMDAANKLGAQINNIFGWRPSMQNFDIEVVLRIEEDRILTMIALNQESLFKRNICAFGPTTMRSTMCYCMLAIADIKPGDIVVDAMCGGGSIPIEGAASHQNAFFMGGDHHNLALARCQENLVGLASVRGLTFALGPDKGDRLSTVALHSPLNLRATVVLSPHRNHLRKLGQANNLAEIGGRCDFSFWDASNLPLRSESVDVLVTDLPFGKKMGSVEDNRILYPKLFKEWQRVVRKGGRLVVMSHDKRSVDKAIRENRDYWNCDSTSMVNVGGMICICSRLIRR